MYQCHRCLDAATNKSMNSERKCRRSWCIGVVARRLKYSAGFWFGKHTGSDVIPRGQEGNLLCGRREARFRCYVHEFSPFIPLPHVNTSTKLIIRNGSDSAICRHIRCITSFCLSSETERTVGRRRISLRFREKSRTYARVCVCYLLELENRAERTQRYGVSTADLWITLIILKQKYDYM